MTEPTKDLDLATMSGEKNIKATTAPRYDEITLDGNYGMYKVKHITQELQEVQEGGVTKKKYPTSELGEKIEFVWLKIRRQLTESTDTGLVRQTNEHNHKNDVVTIKHWTGQADESMVASSINGATGKYPKMKVRQIIYALDIASGKIYRIISKGMSNTMKDKPEDATLFYDYLFGLGKDEHFYTMTNIMESNQAKTGVGLKYFSNFSKGRTLSESEMELVKEKMKEVHDATTLYDNTRVIVQPSSSVSVDTDSDDDDTISLDDIPF